MDSFLRTAVVGSCPSRTEAELQKHVLEGSGIPTTIGSDDAGGLHPELGFSRCATYRLLVPEDRVTEARGLLDAFEDAPPIDVVADDEPSEASDRAEVGLGRTASLVLAVLLVAIVLAAVISNLLNVFTAS